MSASSLYFFENWRMHSLTAAAIGFSAASGAIGTYLTGGYKVTAGALFGAFDGAVQGAIFNIWNKIFNPTNENVRCLLGTASIASSLFAAPAISWQLCKFVDYSIGSYGDALIMQIMTFVSGTGVLTVAAVTGGIFNVTYDIICEEYSRRRAQPIAVPIPPV